MTDDIVDQLRQWAALKVIHDEDGIRQSPLSALLEEAATEIALLRRERNKAICLESFFNAMAAK